MPRQRAVNEHIPSGSVNIGERKRSAQVPLVSSDAIAVNLTGLSVERLHDASARVEQRDVDAAATEEQKAWLRARFGWSTVWIPFSR